MNWFRRLLGLNEDQMKSNENNQDAKIEIPESLFIENNPPSVEKEISRAESKLNKFLNDDYYNQGFNAGYHYHSAEILEHYICKIRSEYLLLLDQLIDDDKITIQELKFHYTEVDGLSEKSCKQIENKIIDLEKEIQEIEKQKGLCVEDEGWLAVVLNIFRLAYIQGLEKYHEISLFAKSSGLFN